MALMTNSVTTDPEPEAPRPVHRPAMAAPEATIEYRSARKELRLTKVARYPRLNPEGKKIGEHPGEFVAFRHHESGTGGVARFAKSGPLTLIDSLNGGVARLDDALELHTWLQEHPLYGDLTQGFWEAEVTAPAVTRDELDALLQAALSFDVDGLAAMVEEERAGWARPDLLEAAEKALARLQEMGAQPENAALAEREAALEQREADLAERESAALTLPSEVPAEESPGAEPVAE